MDQKLFYSIQDKMRYEFTLDMNSLYQHLETVKEIKFEIICLKGLELTAPNQFEKKAFE
jgi:hypothetical protein